METLRNYLGNVISKSRNLAGPRRWVGRMVPIRCVHLIKLPDEGRGEIRVYWDDSTVWQSRFESFAVLVRVVSMWRNMYGAKCHIFVKDKDGKMDRVVSFWEEGGGVSSKLYSTLVDWELVS